MASLVELAPILPAASPGATVDAATDPGQLLAHQAFVMTAISAANGAPPAAEAFYVGWRYVIGSAQGDGVATVGEDALRQVHRFAAHDRGSYAAAAPTVVRALAEQADALPKNYELRFLGLPALYVEAVWLKDLDGDEDLVCPFGPVPEGIVASTVYSVDLWIAAVRPVALRTLAIANEFEQRQ